jgi:hypothetical protein
VFQVRAFGLHIGAIATIAIVSACASTPGSIKTVTPVADRTVLSKYDTLVIQADAVPAAQCTSADLSRITQLTKAKVEELAPGRFRTIAVVGPGEATSATGGMPYLNADLTLTCYDRGDAAARFLMAGLGQMQITGELMLSEQPVDRPVGRYNIDKSFAWGGIYGATTDIEDIEAAFAEATAEAILGEQ